MKRQLFCHLTVFVILFFLWEILAQYKPWLCFVFPQPSKIFVCAIHSYQTLLYHSLYTLQGILGGFGLACILSICLASCMLVVPSIKKWIHPLLIFIQCTPMFALAPLIVLWVGWSIQAVILPTALTIFFPLTLTIYQGIQSIPPELKEQFILFQATPWQTLFKLRIPHALPYIFSGLKVAIISAGFAAIAGEWVAAQKGLGILILESRRNYHMELTFAGLLTLSLLTFALFQLVLVFEKWVFYCFRIPTIRDKVRGKIFKWSIVAIPLALLLVVYFIPFNSEKKTTANEKLTYLQLLLDWTPNANHIPLYVGIEKHFFQNEGIYLDIRKNLETGSGIPHLLLEQTDLTLYHCLGIIKAVLKGSPIQIVGRLIDSSLQGFIYRKDDEITKLEDLHDKVLGFCLNQTNDIAYLLHTLRLHHIIPKEMKNVSADLISPMLLKKVDFLYGAFYNIQGEKLKSLGMPVGIFLSDTYHLHTGPQLLLCGKKGTLATHPQITQALQKALQKSIDFCKQHPDEAFDIYCQTTKQTRKNTEDERMQWQATISLLASSQDQLPPDLILNILENIKHRYPKLVATSSTFNAQQLYASHN